MLETQVLKPQTRTTRESLGWVIWSVSVSFLSTLPKLLLLLEKRKQETWGGKFLGPEERDAGSESRSETCDKSAKLRPQ